MRFNRSSAVRVRFAHLFIAFLLMSYAALAFAAPEAREPKGGHDDIGTAKAVTQPTAFLVLLTEDSAAHVWAQTIEGGGVSASAAKRAPRTLIAAADSAARAQAEVANRQQERLLARIESRGLRTKMIYRIQRALNAIAFEVSPSEALQIGDMPDVKRVMPIELEYPTANKTAGSDAVPFMNVPAAWGLPVGAGNADGTGIKIGIIDTGIDYLHGDFGGSGLLADYQANNRTVAPDAYFPTAKVVGGTDFAGDNYNGTVATIAADPDPMDCNGHGSHVAGIAAGFGVTAAGATFAGPYNGASTFDYASMRIHPGVAPKALLYGLRVFGCGGGTNLTNLAIDWAMDPNNDNNLSDHLDVINMSLGSDYGNIASSTAIAADAAAAIGVATVVSAGNSGDVFYIVGSPGSGDRVTTVAAAQDDGLVANVFRVNSPAGIAGNYGNTISLQFGGSPPPGGVTGTLVQAIDPADGAGPLTTDACSPLTNAAAIAGNVAFIDRGTCGFLNKAQFAQQAGAIGVVIASNSAAALGNMSGVDATVTIPVILITQADGNTLRANLASNPSVTFFNGGDLLASFSSRGVRGGVTKPRQKPDVAAPGVSIISVQTGTTCTGTAPSTGCQTVNATGFLASSQTLVLSGTSMACPQIAGLSALMKQLHPDWTTEEIKAAIVNTANHDMTTLPDGGGNKHAIARAGAGRADASRAATTTAMAFNADESGAVGIAFAEDLLTSGTRIQKVRVENKSAASVTYDLSIVTIEDAPGISFSLPGGSSVTVPAGSSALVNVQVNIDPSILKHARDINSAATQTPPGSLAGLGAINRHWITEESSNLVLSVSGNEKLRVPLHATSRPASAMNGNLTSSGTPVANGAGVTGTDTYTLSGTPVCTGTLAPPVCTGTFPNDEVSLVMPFELQIASPADPVSSTRSADVQYAGVAFDGVNNNLMFGVSTYGDWNSANETTVNIYIDTNNDGVPERILAGGNAGQMNNSLFSTSSGSDTYITLVFNPSTNGVSAPVAPGRFVTSDPGARDNALYRTNVQMVSAAPTTLGLPAGVTAFKWKVVTCPGFATFCKQRNGFWFDETPWVSWDYNTANQGLNFNGTRIVSDLPTATIPVTWNTTNLATNASLGTLLLHTHNKAGARAQVLPIAGAPTTDLAVTLGVSPSATTGQNVTLSVTVTNNGGAATGIQVPITIPSGMTYVSDDGAGAFATASETWTIPALANGASTTLHIIETLQTNEPQDVIAQIAGVTPLDINFANNTAQLTYSPFRTSELNLGAVAGSPTVFVGNPVTYTYTVTNNGVDPAYNINLNDAFASLPSLQAGSAVASHGVYNNATHTWNISSLDSGRTATLQLNVTAPNMAGNLTTNGTTSSTYNDPNLVNNSASATSVVLSPSNVAGTKTFSGTTYPGSTITYTVTLTNSAAFDQQNNPGSEFTDILPAALTLVSANATSGTAVATVATNTVTWDGVVPASGSVTITITATIKSNVTVGTTISNQGSIAYDADGNGTNEASRVTDDPSIGGASDSTSFVSTSPATISVATKTVSGQFRANGAVVYTVTLTNSGPSTQLDNSGHEFNDVLPAGLTLVSANATSGTAVATVGTNTVTWDGTLAASASVTITINATVNAAVPPFTTITNQGTASYDANGDGTNEATKVTDDPSIGGAADATSFVTQSPASLASPTKSVSGQFYVGGAVTYTVTLMNSGTNAQLDNPTNEFSDVLPAALTLVSANATSGTAVATVGTNTVTWNGSIAAGASVTITINATVKSGTVNGTVISNQATVNYDANGDGTNETSTVTDDPGTGAAGDATSFTVVSPSSITNPNMTVTGAPFMPGSTVTYALTIMNGGPGVQGNNPGDEFTITLPASVTLVNSSASAGTATTGGNTVHWNGSLAVGASVNIGFTATINSGTPVNTIVSAQGTVNFDANGDGTNESSVVTNDPSTAAANDPTSFTVVSPATVTTATKTVSPTIAQVGNNVTYTVTFTNSGPGTQLDNPTNEFTDVLPATLTLVSANATSGTAVATVATNTVTWNGQLTAGASVTITIVATINSNSNSTIANQGTVSFDADGNGTNESTKLTDGPGGGPTILTLLGNVPALSPLALMLLAIALAGAAMFVMRQLS